MPFCLFKFPTFLKRFCCAWTLLFSNPCYYAMLVIKKLFLSYHKRQRLVLYINNTKCPLINMELMKNAYFQYNWMTLVCLTLQLATLYQIECQKGTLAGLYLKWLYIFRYFVTYFKPGLFQNFLPTSSLWNLGQDNIVRLLR